MADSATPLPSTTVHVETTETENVEDIPGLSSMSQPAQPAQNLSSQDLVQLDRFIYFPKLPIELRLKIWRYTFPAGQYVYFDLRLGGARAMQENTFLPESTDRQRAEIFESTRPLLVALAICSESRAETLRHYVVIRRPQPVNDDPTSPFRHPFCFNPTRDVAYIANDNLWGHYSQGWPELALKDSASFEAIQTVEIRVWFWNKGIGRILERSCLNGDNRHGYFKRVLSFPKLSKIRIILTGMYAVSGVAQVDQAMKQTEESVRKFLEYHKNHWNGSTPIVEDVRWSPLRELARDGQEAGVAS